MIDLRKLRKLYRKASPGGTNRTNLKITITPETREMVEVFVPLGKGRYGSPLFELSVRTLLALFGNGEDIEEVALELKSVIKSPYFINNLEMLLRYIKA